MYLRTLSPTANVSADAAEAAADLSAAYTESGFGMPELLEDDERLETDLGSWLLFPEDDAMVSVVAAASG